MARVVIQEISSCLGHSDSVSKWAPPSQRAAGIVSSRQCVSATPLSAYKAARL